MHGDHIGTQPRREACGPGGGRQRARRSVGTERDGVDAFRNESERRVDNDDGNTVVVRTDSNEYHAKSLVITAGAWASRCVADLGVPLQVLRKFVAWFPIRRGEYRVSEGTPTYFFEQPHGTFYGFPSLDGQTIKVAEHSGGQVVSDPAAVDRERHEFDTNRLTDFVAAHLTGIEPVPVRHSVCLYTVSPDQHFIVDRHPRWSNVAIACGFSGHGFKFAPVMGEVLADLVQHGRTSQPIGFLGLNRFNPRSISDEFPTPTRSISTSLLERTPLSPTSSVFVPSSIRG